MSEHSIKSVVKFLESSKPTSRPVESSLFGFDNFAKVVSYVPQKNKSVIFLTTEHHDIKIDTNKNNKPICIDFYNHKKVGVDTFEYCIQKYTCKRRCNRWPLVVFMYILDCAAYNSYILGKSYLYIVYVYNVY